MQSLFVKLDHAHTHSYTHTPTHTHTHTLTHTHTHTHTHHTHTYTHTQTHTHLHTHTHTHLHTPHTHTHHTHPHTYSHTHTHTLSHTHTHHTQTHTHACAEPSQYIEKLMFVVLLEITTIYTADTVDIRCLKEPRNSNKYELLTPPSTRRIWKVTAKLFVRQLQETYITIVHYCTHFEI